MKRSFPIKGNRPLEQESLPVLGTHVYEGSQYVLIFDPFRNHLFLQPLATSFNAFTKMRLASSVARSRMKLPSIFR